MKESNENETQLNTVRGQVPEWIDGTLFRNGPGRHEFDNNKSYDHLFDGQACVQKFRIKNGRIIYKNKLLETEYYTYTSKTNQLYPLFSSNKEKAGLLYFLQRAYSFLNLPETNDNVNVSLVPFGNEKLYALTESHVFCRIDPIDLKVIDRVKINEYFPGMVTTLAHPHIEKDGSWITCGMNPKKTCYEFLKYDASEASKDSDNCCKNAKLIASLPSSYAPYGLAYFHSFGLTEN
jgi:carotenoid cleavage dioxygenase-like enzyme